MRMIDRVPGCLVVGWLFLVSAAGTTFSDAARPTLTDSRLGLTLFAEDPEIVTPIGMAIDNRDRVFVVESHTHNPPADYEGPDGDRIKLLVDEDQDGHADSISVFADGIQQAMNLAFSPDGQLYVVCAREVLHLIDEDGDGRCDRKERVVELVTKQRYPHNCLLGITFDRDGWMYVARGNTGSDAYRAVGTDGSTVEGFGDGGNVIRCRSDGTELTEFATGFWNPFDLKFDRHGELLLVDNDPDARGPNRLLRVVRGGDYGYKSMFGGSGTHPFQGWDGSLPGTLPYLAGTGEAPSGLIDCRRASLPKDYGRSVLATIWNEHTIERFELDPDSGKLVNKSIFMTGGQDFRPVALDCDSHGNLFVTDWVLVDYPNHGRGRIWRISTNARPSPARPQGYFEPYEPTELRSRLDGIAKLDGSTLLQKTSTGQIVDPFQRHAVVMRLSEEGMESGRRDFIRGNADARLVGLLASKRAGETSAEQISGLLLDPDPNVRRAALMWAAESQQLSLAPRLQSVLTVEPVTPELFETYLAATEVLTPEFVDALRRRTELKANKLPRRLDPRQLTRVAQDTSIASSVRRLAIKRFEKATMLQQIDFVAALLRQDDDTLTIAAIELLMMHELAAGQIDSLEAIAMDSRRSAAVRTQALASLAMTSGFDAEKLDALTRDSDRSVAVQARRIRRSLAGEQGLSDGRPASRQRWHEALSEGGDPLLGRHVFYSGRVGCAKCHHLDGRGGTLGPALHGVAQSKSREQIIDAILDPSAEFAPQYQAWMVLTVDGTVHRGLQLDHKANGAIVLTLEDGQNRYFKGAEVDAYRAMPKFAHAVGSGETDDGGRVPRSGRVLDFTPALMRRLLQGDDRI